MKKILIGVISIVIVALIVFGVTVLVVKNSVKFKDLDKNAEYYTYVVKLSKEGIVDGYDEKTFAPDKTCTREELISFLYKASGSPAPAVTESFTDVESDAPFAAAVAWAKENGITRGYADGTFGVGKALDKNQALVFLHEWAKLTGRVGEEKELYLTSFTDASEIEIYALSAFAWALYEGLVSPEESDTLAPSAEITRGDAAVFLGKIYEKHYHAYEYTDNKDGTHTATCTFGKKHSEKVKHTFNDGELVKKADETEDGEILYTCTACLAEKREKVEFGKEIVTRADLEEAIVATAWAYYAKGDKVQYDSTHLSKTTAYLGGTIRLTAEVSPEFATSDTSIYSVCSDYTYQAFYEALGIRSMGDINFKHGTSTAYLFRLADNQPNAGIDLSRYNDPFTEGDVDTALMRFVDFDAYQEEYSSRLRGETAFGVYESSAFTDYTEGIRFLADGYDGEVHYSYYDEEGNKLSAKDVQKDNVVAFAKDYKNTMRPGDFFVHSHHALLYIGNGKALHCSGYKIDADTGVDKVEDGGAILYLSGIGNYFGIDKPSWVVLRPLDKIVAKGYDDDDGNDIVKGFKLPESTETRIENPMLEIDRTVNISPYGTAYEGEELTYTVNISNMTNEENYNKWAKKAYKSYKNLTVTEKVPEGTEFVSASEGAVFENGIITWNIEKLPPSETQTLTYIVKVLAKAGEKIVSDGGMVGNIPSNTIVNTVGKRIFTEEAVSLLAEIPSSDKLEDFGADTDFAENLYKKAGLELDLPKASEIVDALFTVENIAPGTSEGAGGLYPSNFEKKNMFVKQDEVSDGFKDVKAMLIDKFYGGYRFFVGEKEKFDYANNTIKEFRPEYLEAGDIIISAQSDVRGYNNLSSSFKIIKVLVYDGERLLSVRKSSSGVTYKIYQKDEIKKELTKLLANVNDLFFALRPSQTK